MGPNLTADGFLNELLAPEVGRPRPRYQVSGQPDSEIELIPGVMYRYRLLDTLEGEAVTLNLFLEVGRTGGALWEQALRTLERIAGLDHPALPRLRDGGYLPGPDGQPGAAYIRVVSLASAATAQTLAERFSADRGMILPHLWLLADALALMHDAHIVHRALCPDALELEFDDDGSLKRAMLARFEMSGLLANLFNLAGRRRFQADQIRQLYLGAQQSQRVYSPPERLRFLFGVADGTLGGAQGDVFSLGVMAAGWLLGASSVSGSCGSYEEVVQTQRQLRSEVSRRRNELPGSLGQLVYDMLDPSPKGRPSAREVCDAIGKGFADMRMALQEDLPTSPYLIAYMPAESDQTLLNWGLIQASATTPEGQDQLIELIESDMRGAEVMYSPAGAEKFASGPPQRLRRAKTVIVGPQVTWFCDYLVPPDDRSRVVDQMLVIKYVRKTEDIRVSIDRLRVHGLTSRLPMVQAIAIPKRSSLISDLCAGRPSWRGLVTQAESSRALTERERSYLDALDWYLDYQRALLDARTYAYVVEPGASPGTAALRWDTVTDRGRRLPSALSRLLVVTESYRIPLADFVKDAGDSGQGIRVHLALTSGFDERMGPFDVLETRGNDTIIVSSRRGQAVPAKGWIRLLDDAGTVPQLRRQADARVELESQRVLLNQLIQPNSVPRLESWDNAGGSLEGEGRQAVRDLLRHDGLFALQGPPGTGKTEVTAQAVADYLERYPASRVLVSAQSHDALENLAVRILRKLHVLNADGGLGRLDRLPLRLPISPLSGRDVDSRVARFLPNQLVEGVVQYSTLSARRWLSSQRTERPALMPIVRDWLTELPSARMELDRRVRSGANVVFATTGSATEDNLLMDATDEPFDWVLIEEAAKAWPTELALALVRGVRWTLVGDHAQIGAYAKTNAEKLLNECNGDPDPEVSEMYDKRDEYLRHFGTFQHLFELPTAPRRTLTEQRRMHQDIAGVVGDTFYAGTGGLKTLRPAASHPLNAPRALLDSRLIWVDTGLAERSTGFWSNELEAQICADLVEQMLPRPVPVGASGGPSLAVLTPYRDQVDLLRGRITHLQKSISTVDGFQGREADVVVASLVRDRLGKAGTPISTVGHVADPARINVLLSRARELLVVVGRLEVYAEHAGEQWSEVTRHFAANGTIIRQHEWSRM